MVVVVYYQVISLALSLGFKFSFYWVLSPHEWQPWHPLERLFWINFILRCIYLLYVHYFYLLPCGGHPKKKYNLNNLSCFQNSWEYKLTINFNLLTLNLNEVYASFLWISYSLDHRRHIFWILSSSMHLW